MIELQFGKAILCFRNKNKEKNEADSVYYQRWPFGKKYEVKLGGIQTNTNCGKSSHDIHLVLPRCMVHHLASPPHFNSETL
jgi:hypothetical protein